MSAQIRYHAPVTSEPTQPASAPTGVGHAPALARQFRWWLAIALVALGLRLTFLYEIREMPFVTTPMGDAAAYHTWAQRIAAGDWLGSDVFYQAPAYPYFLAVLYRVFGDGPFVSRVPQALLGTLSCMLLGLAGRRFFSDRVGLLAALVLALYPPAIFFDGLIQKTSLALVLVCALLWRLGVLQNKASPWRWLGVGLLLGVLGLTRENALVLSVVVLGWAALGFRDRGVTKRLSWMGMTLVGMALVLGPVALRNHHVGGVWALTTVQAGPNFYIGNHDGATGRYTPLVRGHESPPFEHIDAKRLAEQAVGHELTDAEVSHYWLSQSWMFIRSNPLAWLRLVGLKTLLAINHYEITDTEGFNVYRDLAPVLSVLSPFLHFGVVVPLAAAGVVLTWSNRRALVILYATEAALLASVVLFYVFARYRFPLIPVCILFASAGVLEGLRHWRSATIHKLAKPAVVLIAATILTNLSVNPERKLNALAYANLGTVLAQTGNYKGAINVFLVALEETPQSPELHYNLGLAYRIAGRIPEALHHWSIAKQLNPSLIEVDFQLGALYEAIGQRKSAIQHYQEALRITPHDKAAQDALAKLQGSPQQAPHKNNPRPQGSGQK